MKTLRRLLFIGVLTFILAVSSVTTFAQAAENLAECVADGAFDSTVDYFPEKAELIHAENFSIDYFSHYKVITVTTPWFGAAETDAFQYVLVQCGTPTPAGFDDAAIIEVPSDDIIALSTAQLPQLEALGLLDLLVGVDNLSYVNNAEVLAKGEAGELVEVGSGASINVELVLETEPSIVMVNGSGAPEYDAHPVLLDANVFVAMNADWVEPTLLGRAEWIKFLAAFYNLEGDATAIYDTIVSEYDTAAALVADIPAEERVTVLWNSYQTYTESWSIPGQETWVGALLQDAGVNWVAMDEAPTESAQLSFEQVYDAGFETPLWVINAFGIATLDDLAATDARNADFAAFQNGGVYDNAKRINPSGFNDFWETGVTNPHLLLKDLIALFYPDLLPDHELMFYNQLEAAQ